MDKQISVPVSEKKFLEVAAFLGKNAPHLSPVDAVSLAIDYWVENLTWKKEDLLPRPTGGGYTWSSKDARLFLPDQTDIRMKYKGEFHYAKVIGDSIIWNGKSCTPAQLANLITGTSRNAWRDLWVKRPGEKQWSLADDLRD